MVPWVSEGMKDKQEGLIEMAIDCVMMCDNDIKSDLLFNIVLAGGTTVMPGF